MEITKVCFKCRTEKNISEFYKHGQMPDGHLNKCKECTKKDVKENYIKKIEDPEYVEKERARGREKYKRLNYVERTHYKKNYSRSTRSIHRFFKSLNIDLKEKELHHWNYTLKHDVFILNKRAHKLVHKDMVYSEDKNCFITNDGIELSTKKMHYEYIVDTFVKNNVNYEIESYPEN